VPGRPHSPASPPIDLSTSSTHLLQASNDGLWIGRGRRDQQRIRPALEWSRREWEREEAEQQRRLLDLAAAERRAAAAALPQHGAPVVKLEESSDDELYRPTPPRFGDAGQGSSRQAPPPQDSGDSLDDGGDYTRFYRHFGM
jgi:hypothetical protein